MSETPAVVTNAANIPDMTPQVAGAYRMLSTISSTSRRSRCKSSTTHG